MISIYKIFIIALLCASAYGIVKLLIENKTLLFISEICDKYEVTPELVKSVMKDSKNIPEVETTLEKLINEVDKKIIELEQKANDEITKNKIGFDIYS